MRLPFAPMLVRVPITVDAHDAGPFVAGSRASPARIGPPEFPGMVVQSCCQPVLSTWPTMVQAGSTVSVVVIVIGREDRCRPMPWAPPLGDEIRRRHRQQLQIADSLRRRRQRSSFSSAQSSQPAFFQASRRSAVEPLSKSWDLAPDQRPRRAERAKGIAPRCIPARLRRCRRRTAAPGRR